MREWAADADNYWVGKGGKVWGHQVDSLKMAGLGSRRKEHGLGDVSRGWEQTEEQWSLDEYENYALASAVKTGLSVYPSNRVPESWRTDATDWFSFNLSPICMFFLLSRPGVNILKAIYYVRQTILRLADNVPSQGWHISTVGSEHQVENRLILKNTGK